MSPNKKTISTFLLALVVTISFLNSTSTARHIPSSQDLESSPSPSSSSSSSSLSGIDGLPQTEVLKQQNLALRQQLARMNNMILKEQDVADSAQSEQQSFHNRQQRSVVNYDQDFLSPLQSLEDEPLMRRQLPDLFAQLRNDKSFEKVLTKLLINSSLRSALLNNGINNGQVQDNVNWPGNDNVRLDQAIDGFAPIFNDLVQSFNQQDSVAKRGSRCAFNAVACKSRKAGYVQSV